MAIYINSPQWFQGIDSIIELLSLIVAFMISFMGYKVYKLIKQKKYAYFSTAFFLIGLSYIFKIISELAIYVKEVQHKIIGPFLFSQTVLEPVTWIHVYSHATFRLLSAFAILILLAVALNITNKQTLLLFTYFIAAITLISNYAQFIFHLTQAVMLGILVLHFYDNYNKNNTKHAALVAVSFLGMLISHTLFIFMMYDPAIYAIGEAFHLAAFATLLYAFILVKRK